MHKLASLNLCRLELSSLLVPSIAPVLDQARIFSASDEMIKGKVSVVLLDHVCLAIDHWECVCSQDPSTLLTGILLSSEGTTRLGSVRHMSYKAAHSRGSQLLRGVAVWLGGYRALPASIRTATRIHVSV